MRCRREAGSTLIELVIVVALIALFVGAIGVFFLGTAPGVVSAAEHDVSNAFNEARRTAVAYEAATVVVEPKAAGSGFVARVYRSGPGDALYTAVNGPAYESDAVVQETAAPLGAPGFAFKISAGGTITGYRNYTPGGALDAQPCPASSAFILRLSTNRDVKTVVVPCHIELHSNAPIVRESPSPNVVAVIATPGSCPAGRTCSVIPQAPGSTSCPPGYTQDPVDPSLCNPPTPPPSPSTAPVGGGGGGCPSGPISSSPSGALAGWCFICDVNGSPNNTLLGYDTANNSVYSNGPCSSGPTPTPTPTSAPTSAPSPASPNSNVFDCSSQPLGTFLYTDAAGNHYSNGTACGTSQSPSPTATATPMGPPRVIESVAYYVYNCYRMSGSFCQDTEYEVDYHIDFYSDGSFAVTIDSGTQRDVAVVNSKIGAPVSWSGLVGSGNGLTPPACNPSYVASPMTSCQTY